MKALKISFLILALAILSIPQAMATGDDTNAQLKKKLVKMIQTVDLSGMETDEAEAMVEFVVNNDSEIVVMSVDTDSDFAEHLIKSKINYHTVNVDGVKRHTTYRIKVRFIKEL